jgi:hypothetical protein
MRDQGVRLDKQVLEQIYTARKTKTAEIIERYHLWEERGKKVIKRVPIWRSDKVLDVFEQQFGIRPKDRTRLTWQKLVGDPSLKADAKEFAEAIIDLGQGANDAHWLGKATESGEGDDTTVDFSKVSSDGFIYPRYDICGSPDRAVTSHPNCFDDKTEVLTKRGWRLWSDCDQTEELAQFDTDTHAITFVAPLAWQSYYRNEPMVGIKSGLFIDLLVTPDHRCLLQQRKRKAEFFFTPASAYSKDAKQYVAGNLEQSGLSVESWKVTLIAAMQADGHIRQDCNAVEFAFDKPRKVKALHAALTASGLTFKVDSYKKKGHRGRTTRFYISNPPLWLKEKYFANHDIFGWDSRAIKQLSKELWRWDGCFQRQSHYSSSVESNADWAQAICVVSGIAAKKRLYVTPHGRSNWQIDARQNPYSLTGTRTLQICNVPYSGMVYCATMPKGTVIVRRNGVVAITGQCQNFPRPSDDPRPVKLRSAVIPLDPSHVILGCDFSGVETITNAFESKDMARVQAALNKTISHEGTAKIINDTFGLDLNRHQGKACNHAFDKGESPFNLAKRLFKTERPSRQQTLQCQQIFGRMLAEYPETSKFRDHLWEQARSNPLVVTNAFGRKLMCFSRAKYGDTNDRFTKHSPEKKYWCSCPDCSPRRDRWKYAIAFLGRSCAFDALLRVMARIWYERRLDAFSLPYLEVHDELVYSVPQELGPKYSRIVKEAFEEPFPELNGIRLPAEAKTGMSWAAAH